jgi:hypothetical protein
MLFAAVCMFSWNQLTICAKPEKLGHHEIQLGFKCLLKGSVIMKI